MAVEIERKFLVDWERFPVYLCGLPAVKITQGYISVRPVVRVRIETDKLTAETWATLTLKGEGRMERPEFEYSIPTADARKLMKTCDFRKVEKIRHYVDGWEVDEFLGRHKGLWLAEKEYKSRRAANAPQKFPAWIGVEVTQDDEYHNSMLAKTVGGGKFQNKTYEELAKESVARQERNLLLEAGRK